MKPRTKFEKFIFEHKDSLPEIPEEVVDCIPLPSGGHRITDTKCFCGHCGRFFEITEPPYIIHGFWKIPREFYNYDCPLCNCHLSLSRWPLETEYPEKVTPVPLNVQGSVVYFTSFQNVQLIRLLECKATYIACKRQSYEITEIATIWMNEKGVTRTTRKSRKRDETDNDAIDIFNDNRIKIHKYNNLIIQSTTLPFSYYLNHYWYRISNTRDFAPFLKIRGVDLLTSDQLIDGAMCWEGRAGLLGFGANTLSFLKTLIKYPFVEKFIKDNDIETLKGIFSYSVENVEIFLPSLLICKRHNYIPQDFGLWVDMVLMLNLARKDIRNLRYICPMDLREGHQFALQTYEKYKERQRKKEQEEWERNRPHDIFWFLDKNPKEREKCFENTEYLYELEQIYGGFEEGCLYWIDRRFVEHTGKYSYDLVIERFADNEDTTRHEGNPNEYLKLIKGHLFDIILKDGNLQLVSLDSIEDYRKEARKMHNCIESLGYWRKKDTLILSARKYGKSIADVEISLLNFSILQCWGPCNTITPYKTQIEKLINDNKHIFKERIQLRNKVIKQKTKENSP